MRSSAASRALCAALALPLFAVAASRAAPETVWARPVFSRMDSLFIVAATGEPRFEAERAAAEKTLLSLDTVTLNYLVGRRLRDQTPRQQHYVERLFTVISDSGRNPRAREVLTRALSAAPSDTLRIQLLYVGSGLGDTAFRAAALPWLGSASEPVRRMAVRSLGAYPNPLNLPLLWNGLTETHGLELQQRLWALEAQGAFSPGGGRDWRRLVPLLNDSLFFNRQKARDLLLKAADSSWAALRPALPKSLTATERREWRLLALDAKGGREFLEREKAGMTDAERIYFGLGH